MDLQGFKSTKQYGFPEISPRGPDPPQAVGTSTGFSWERYGSSVGKMGGPTFAGRFFFVEFPYLK